MRNRGSAAPRSLFARLEARNAVRADSKRVPPEASSAGCGRRAASPTGPRRREAAARAARSFYEP